MLATLPLLRCYNANQKSRQNCTRKESHLAKQMRGKMHATKQFRIKGHVQRIQERAIPWRPSAAIRSHRRKRIPEVFRPSHQNRVRGNVGLRQYFTLQLHSLLVVRCLSEQLLPERVVACEAGGGGGGGDMFSACMYSVCDLLQLASSTARGWLRCPRERERFGPPLEACRSFLSEAPLDTAVLNSTLVLCKYDNKISEKTFLCSE